MFRKTFFALPVVAAMLFAAAPAFAHEQQTFRIGGKTYTFVVGTLNEPVFVDDKTGVDLRVSRAPLKGEKVPAAHDDGDGDNEEVGVPVTGLDKSLKVELIAGDKKKVLDLAPAYGDPGAYKAPFYPTVATTLSYRVFGDLDGTSVDLLFTCNPAGHPQTPEDATETKIDEKVTRLKKSGAFGCPQSKADAGFPEPSASLRELAAAKSPAAPSAPSNAVPIGLSAVALAFGTAALARRK